MERNTQTTPMHLKIGDRFHKANDRHKTVLQMEEHKPLITKYQTYRHWCRADNDAHAHPIKWNTPVIFLRHTNEQPATAS